MFPIAPEGPINEMSSKAKSLGKVAVSLSKIAPNTDEEEVAVHVKLPCSHTPAVLGA